MYTYNGQAPVEGDIVRGDDHGEHEVLLERHLLRLRQPHLHLLADETIQEELLIPKVVVSTQFSSGSANPTPICSRMKPSKNHCLADMWSGSEEGSYLRLITQL